MERFNSPFRQLRKQALKRMKPPPHATPKSSGLREPSKKYDDAELFQREMSDVIPLKKDDNMRVSSPPPPIIRRTAIDTENEAIAELYDLVAGRSDFDITDTDEYMEGCVMGHGTFQFPLSPAPKAGTETDEEAAVARQAKISCPARAA